MHLDALIVTGVAVYCSMLCIVPWVLLARYNVVNFVKARIRQLLSLVAVLEYGCLHMFTATFGLIQVKWSPFMIQFVGVLAGAFTCPFV